MRWNNLAAIIMPGVLLIAALWGLEVTGADLSIQQLFFSNESQSWLVDKQAALPRLIFYDGIKKLIITFGFAILGYQLYRMCVDSDPTDLRGLRIVLLSMILVPAVVGLLKNITNIACPSDLAVFGGDADYIGLFKGLVNSAQSGMSKCRCFPAGHASGGFALMSLYYLNAQSRRRRIAWLLLGVCVGWIMGAYKMIIGDHFLSHTLTTMVLAWIIIQMVAMFFGRKTVTQ